FGDNGEDQGLEHQQGESSNAKEVSSDHFNIYGLLDKRTKEVRTTDMTTSIPYPPGFTPVNEIPASIKQDAPEVESDRPPNRSERSNSRVLEEVANSVDRSSSESINNGIKLKEGGSILEILEEMITVGQTMGFSMEGCTKRHGEDYWNTRRASLPGFDDLVTKSWNSFVLDDSNGVMVDVDWIDDPDLVKQEFRSHFADRFQDPGSRRGSLNFFFPNRLSNDQILDLESSISKDE
nr:RNA-directed DNA polymerase, eukaryota [Tanacetum cinerariifolium]